MSVRYYDDAILQKLRYWTGDSKIKISGPDDRTSLWMARADQTNTDSITLPLVSLTRGQSITILSTNKKPLSYDGKKFAANENKVQQLNGIPISINYQLDIYTRHRVENDDLWREFVFKIINNPKLFVEIPYKEEKIMHVFNMRITDTVEDNSDIPEHLISGEFFRSTLNIYVDDAYLFDYKVKDTLSLEVGVKPDKQEDIEWIDLKDDDSE